MVWSLVCRDYLGGREFPGETMEFFIFWRRRGLQSSVISDVWSDGDGEISVGILSLIFLLP